MNLVALFLIGQLLSKRQFVDIPAVVDPAKPKTIARPRGLGLFELGKIETITQPLIIDPTKFDYGQLDWKPDYKKGRF